MRIIRRNVKTKPKLKRRNTDMRKTRLDSIRRKINIFKTNGQTIVHILHQPTLWYEAQCIILDEDGGRYVGLDIYRMSKKRIKLEDLSNAEQNYLLQELE